MFNSLEEDVDDEQEVIEEMALLSNAGATTEDYIRPFGASKTLNRVCREGDKRIKPRKKEKDCFTEKESPRHSTKMDKVLRQRRQRIHKMSIWSERVSNSCRKRKTGRNFGGTRDVCGGRRVSHRKNAHRSYVDVFVVSFDRRKRKGKEHLE